MADGARGAAGASDSFDLLLAAAKVLDRAVRNDHLNGGGAEETTSQALAQKFVQGSFHAINSRLVGVARSQVAFHVGRR